ncbi:MAG: deoxyribose-phosphate aldolase [Steroidobacteraceae bacterium]
MNPAGRLLAALDHTRLGAEDTAATIVEWCKDAATGPRPAAVCVYPAHAAIARGALDAAGAPEVAVAAVVNFPDGGDDLARALSETHFALDAGAAEIDLVFPWHAHLAGDRTIGARMLAQCREACRSGILKVILETGELRDTRVIQELSTVALDAGADFIKTSTGTTATGATPQAARAILECLRARGRGGFKASGGFRSIVEAGRYLELADGILGEGWARPATFRIGASSLLGELRVLLATATG